MLPRCWLFRDILLLCILGVRGGEGREGRRAPRGLGAGAWDAGRRGRCRDAPFGLRLGCGCFEAADPKSSRVRELDVRARGRPGRGTSSSPGRVRLQATHGGRWGEWETGPGGRRSRSGLGLPSLISFAWPMSPRPPEPSRAHDARAPSLGLADPGTHP